MAIFRRFAAAVFIAVCFVTASVVQAQTPKSESVSEVPAAELELTEAKEPVLTTKVGLEEIVRLAERRERKEPANDFERLLGWWVVESCTMDGEPVAEVVGQIEFYSRNGEVEIYGSDYWMRQHFVVDVTTEPRRLGTTLTEGFVDGPGIYAFDGDRLKLRESHEPQQLSFDQPPKGEYWDTTLRKISSEKAKRLLAEREKRLDKLRADESP